MEAGRLRHRVEVQDYVGEEKDSNGNDVRNYTTFASNIPAEIVPMRGRELFAAQQEFSEADVRIGMRYLAGMTDKMRIVHEGVYYGIVSIVDVEMRHVEFVVYCKAGVTDER